MKLLELIAALTSAAQEFGNLDVIMSGDEEGNDFHPLYDLSVELINSDCDPFNRQAMLLWPSSATDEISFMTEVED